MTTTADAERRKAAEGIVQHALISGDHSMHNAAVLGILHGEQRERERERERIVKILRVAADEHRGFMDCWAALNKVATEIERGGKP